MLIPKLRMAAHFSPSVGYVRSKSAFEVRWELGRRKIRRNDSTKVNYHGMIIISVFIIYLFFVWKVGIIVTSHSLEVHP